jgi:hypothetical protein
METLKGTLKRKGPTISPKKAVWSLDFFGIRLTPEASKNVARG